MANSADQLASSGKNINIRTTSVDLREQNILGADIETHWYYRAKGAALLHLLADISPTVILDIGAGSGFFSRKILSETSAREAWCVDISYVKNTDKVEKGKPLHFRRSLDEVTADVILLMDVLEHVNDDVKLLESYVEKARSGTRFVISVPAFQFLWSEHDIFLEHKRRYRLGQIEDVVRQAGLIVKQGAYYFGAVFPIAATLRLASRPRRPRAYEARSQLTRHHRLINEILAAVSVSELLFFAHNRLAGLTAFCVAEKP